MRVLTPLLGFVSLALAGAALAQMPMPRFDTVAPADAWGGWRFLVGDWVGEGSGGPGEGSGSFSFGLELDGRVLVRRNHSEYPAVSGRPATVHDDLMVIYRDERRGGFAAVYFDNEGHVIHYLVELATDGTRVTFLSEPAPTTPGFRLIYTKLPLGALGITFEIAPPGGPGAFKSYLSGKAVRKAGT